MLLTAVGFAGGAVAVMGDPSVGSGVANARYATDAYPGFDTEDENVKPERKSPHWWWWLCGGPARDNAADQLAYCRDLAAEGSYAKACRQLDALVCQWPTALEAVTAQRELAEIRLLKLGDTEEAFREYRYLLDFYALRCGYEEVADRLHQVAGLLKQEGKEVMFVRFANTVDVRRAYEMCVLRAPGAKWVPEAMLTIAALRMDEGRPVEAVKVYENLRNLYPASDEAKASFAREAEARIGLLREHGYNRARALDTVNFLRLAVRNCRPEDVEPIRAGLDEALGVLEDEAYRGAKFYDSPTRTKRSAINAYEQFLSAYPESVHAAEVRARIAELKEPAK